MVTYLIWIAISILLGFVCAFIALRHRKNPLTWFHVGTILSILAFFVIKKTKEKKGKI